MHDRHSISEARRNLPRLVREAEGGGVVKLTRRGNPVAVLIGRQHYERLTTTRPRFTQAYDEFVASTNLTALELDPDELFATAREETSGRTVRL